MEHVSCNTCGSNQFTTIYHKESPLGEVFRIVRCSTCQLVQVNPQPSVEEVIRYYSDSYFTKRTDRGYDNYYSDKIKKEISRVFQMNLADLNFFAWEDNIRKANGSALSSLDIGCAAGYFVDYMKSRGYQAAGIEVANGPVEFARESLGLKIYQEQFLKWDLDFSRKYDVISLWATIEHLHQPKETLEKIKKHLNPGGTLIVSTCRYGILARLAGKKWRYLNVPEHLYYYSRSGLLTLMKSIGYREPTFLSYGSGFTSIPHASIFFKIRKYIADRLVKMTNQGDMMALRVVVA